MAGDGSPPLKDWALYVYFAVDVPEEQLHQSATQNLVQMAALGSSKEVSVAVQIDLPGMLTRRYILAEPPTKAASSSIPPPTLSIPNVNSADPRSIVDFLQWAGQNCPAQNTMVVLWGHGYGLDDYVPPGAHLYSPGVGLNALQLVVSSTRPETFPPVTSLFHSDVSYAEGYDHTNHTVTTNAQIAEAVRFSIPALPGGKKPAILGFASCEMAMAEVWSEMAGRVEYGIASQTGLPAQDWPVDRILKRLQRNPKSDAKTVSQMVIDAFVESYASEPDAYVAISAVDLAQFDGLTQAVKPLADALREATAHPQDLKNIFEARNYCPVFDPDGFIDFGCFCDFLKITMPNSPVSDACDKVLQALKHLVVSSEYSPRDSTKKLSQSTGLSVWFPPWIENPSTKMQEKQSSMAYLDNGYPSTEFAKATGWDHFLVAIRDAAKDPN
jgi:hypothetical protein